MKLALVCVVVAACGGESEFEQRASTYEGIYQVTAYTRNEAACEPGGTSQLGSDTFGLAATQSFAGQQFMGLLSCADVADCRDKLAKIRANQIGFQVDFQFFVDSTGAAGTLTGKGASTGFNMNGSCTMAEVTRTTFAFDGTTLTVEQQITLADPYPPDNGFCTTDLAQQHAAGNACSQMKNLAATFVEPL